MYDVTCISRTSKATFYSCLENGTKKYRLNKNYLKEFGKKDLTFGCFSFQLEKKHEMVEVGGRVGMPCQRRRGYLQLA